MVMTCICDWGYSGADCSLRMCPKGDDPITTLQNNPSLSMTTNATGGVMQGDFVFTFHVSVQKGLYTHQGMNFCFQLDLIQSFQWQAASDQLPRVIQDMSSSELHRTKKAPIFCLISPPSLL